MAEQTQMLSHWHQHIEGLRHSSQQFYASVEDAVQRREIPEVKFSRVEFKEGGMFSAKREYLRVKRGDLYFDICGAPFANGFFVSSRLFAEGSIFESAAGASSLLKAFVKPDTMYRYDTALIMQQLVHDGLMEVVDALTTAQNLPVLPDDKRKPVMRDFYQ